MEVFETIDGFARALDRVRVEGRSVGLVPTMGALHAGHRSLIERAVAECDHVAVTIFVNPLQFGDPADLVRYPRDPEADLSLCRAAGVSAVFAPPVEEMYPGGPQGVATSVSVARLGERWEGASRPGHFDGVATVVTKLFAMAGRCRAYFGEKDFQQLAIVRRLVGDLSLPVEVVGCPTVREPDGLALSSRNARLSPEDRAAAVILSRALEEGCRAAGAPGAVSVGELRDRVTGVVGTEARVELDYAAVVRAENLEPADDLGDLPALRLLIAARIGPVRLIDNCPLVGPGRLGSRGDVASSGAMVDVGAPDQR
jgi:pantoate--beta-alanine ligase